MTKIDFYVLDQQASGNRYTLACRLSEKIYHQGQRVYINTCSEEETRHMDRLLWTFRQGSFVPHGTQGANDPVVIGHQEYAGDACDVLINLAPSVPNFFSRFARVAEMIDSQPEIKTSGRERFRFYRDRGYPLDTHEIK